MKKLSNLGVLLSKEEQKAISGGKYVCLGSNCPPNSNQNGVCTNKSDCSYGECCKDGKCVSSPRVCLR